MKSSNFLTSLLSSVVIIALTAFTAYAMPAFNDGIWFNPWDVVSEPSPGTMAARLRPFVMGPLFYFFATYLLGGIVVAASKIAKTKMPVVVMWLYAHLLLAATMVTYLLVMWENDWTALLSPNFSEMSYQEYVDYNHYLHMLPLIFTVLLAYTAAYAVIIRYNVQIARAFLHGNPWFASTSLLAQIALLAAIIWLGETVGYRTESLLYYIAFFQLPLAIIALALLSIATPQANPRLGRLFGSHFSSAQ